MEGKHYLIIIIDIPTSGNRRYVTQLFLGWSRNMTARLFLCIKQNVERKCSPIGRFQSNQKFQQTQLSVELQRAEICWNYTEVVTTLKTYTTI